MPATLRKPDVRETPPQNGSSREERLEKFVTQRLSDTLAQVSLIAWQADAKRWVAWYDAAPNPPPASAPVAYEDALKEAQVGIPAPPP